MEYIYIGITDKTDKVKDIIYSSLADIKVKDILIDLKHEDVEEDNSVIYLKISVDSKNKLNIVKIHIANVLSQYIIEEYEQKFIKRIINSNYGYFNPGERKEILKTALNNILNLDEKSVFNNIFILRRKNIIVKKLLEYFETSNKIILEGFVTFRLKSYIRELEDVVDKAVDDYLMDKEYREFIRLLKYFVEIQEPKFDIVHVLMGYDNKYILLDEYKNEITNECIQDFIKEVSEGEINYDDLLVSSLITLAPNKICIHMTDRIVNKELMETIKNVFYGKINFCNGCDVCLVNAVDADSRKVNHYINK